MTIPERPLYLLLLPPPPRPASYESLQAAYAPTLTTILKQLTSERSKEPIGTILEIALPCPTLAHTSAARSSLYPIVQPLVATIYKLLCVIAAKEAINIEDLAGIDVRVLLLAYPHKSDAQLSETPEAEIASAVDTVVSIRTLARSRRSWTSVIAIESEEGEAVLHDFLISQDGHLKIRRVPGGVVQVDESSVLGRDNSDNPGLDEDPAAHTSIAVGGTFDHIHVGHKLLLTMFAFMLAPATVDENVRSLTVGITGDELLKNKKYAELLESWDERTRIVLDFMRSIMDFRPQPDAHVKTVAKNEEGPNGHAIHAWMGDKTVIKCVELSDPFGPTITDEHISSLVISAETRSGGKAINDKRQEKGWADLTVFEVDVLDAREEHQSQGEKESFDAKLSSTTIRKALSERNQI